MFPLLCRDNLILPYIAVSALFILIYHAPSRRQDSKEMRSFRPFVTTLLVLCSAVLHIVYLTMQAPPRYPFLFEAMIMFLCFSQFLVLTFYANAKQWMLSKGSNLTDKEKKLLWSFEDGYGGGKLVSESFQNWETIKPNLCRCLSLFLPNVGQLSTTFRWDVQVSAVTDSRRQNNWRWEDGVAFKYF